MIRRVTLWPRRRFIPQGSRHIIELSADRNQLTADGKDLSFINVRVVDKNGNLCRMMPPDPVSVRGAGAYRAAASGNQRPVWNSSIFRK